MRTFVFLLLALAVVTAIRQDGQKKQRPVGGFLKEDVAPVETDPAPVDEEKPADEGTGVDKEKPAPEGE